MKYDILDTIDSPKDIKSLNIGQLKQLCSEIRQYMIECCSVNPGHLGSSLGAVELIIGMHYVYDTPQDKIIFDVGHQAYAHKIITGRREAFKMNRKKDGISGFPKRSESIYDTFGTGHSSTSISAALGFAEAAKQQGLHQKVIALIGDGSLTGGLALEGLNNAGAAKSDILVILNDNNISIDRNIGAIHNYLLHLTTDPKYNKAKKQIWDRLGEGWFRSRVQRMVINAKSSLVRGSGGDFFEAMGFRYFGPINGNDIEQVIMTLGRMKELGGPLLLHTLTKKGKGYAPAEANQTIWHAPGIFDPETGKRQSKPAATDRYQDVFGETLVKLAEMNPKVVGVTPAMASGCGMNKLSQQMPERFYDVGIEEEHAVTFSAGLAAGGMKPFCNIYSSFSQRAYDQIIHDVALQNLGVVICLDRSGLVGEDGATHQCNEDIALMRSIPGMVVINPCDDVEAKQAVCAAAEYVGPVYIRLGRLAVPVVNEENYKFELGKGVTMREGKDVTIIATGLMVARAMDAANTLAADGIDARVINIHTIKPIDKDIIIKASKETGCIITAEEHSVIGGLYSAVTEVTSQEAPCKVVPVAVMDTFGKSGPAKELLEVFNLNASTIVEKVKESIK